MKIRILPLLLLVLAGRAAAQLEWNVLFGHPEFKNAESLLPDHIGRIRSAGEAERERVINGLKTPEQVSHYQERTMARLREVLGAFPERTPLNAKVTGRLDRAGYRIENVVFESRPRYYVTANVYVPRAGKAKYPAVLAPVGHWGAGKFFEDYQRLGRYLAQRGFIVLVYDAPGQGERQQYFDPVMAQTRLSPGNTHWFVTIEHNYAGMQTILTRDHYAAILAWDGVRGIDYLAGRPDVDADKIACTGTSGGGLQTEVLSAIDPRIKVSIPVCYGGCAADTPARRGLGMTSVDALIAPRPLLMIEATGDPRSSVIEKQRKHALISRLYEISGASASTRYLITDEPHGYGESIRRNAYEWLSRWLNGAPPPPETLAEDQAPLESEAALSCTVTGQVKTSLGGETVFSLNRADAGHLPPREQLPTTRQQWTEWRNRLRGHVTGRLSLEPAGPLNARTLGRTDKGTYVIEKVVFHSTADVYVPGILLLPSGGGRHPAVVFVNDGGKTAGGVAEKYLRPMAEAGQAVLAIDPRGVGETAPANANRENNYRGFVHGEEGSLSFSALGAGVTILGMRTRDVLQAVEYLASRPDVIQSQISAIGHGPGGVMVLHAAALDERIRSVAVLGTLGAYSLVVDSEIYAHRPSLFPPGVLARYDLPDLAAAVAPRPLVLINSTGALQDPLDAARAAQVYDPARRMYELLGVEDRFAIISAPSSGEILDRYQQLR